MEKLPVNIRDLFDRILDIESQAERQAYLREACASDPTLFEEISTLLAAHETAGDFLCERLAFDEVVEPEVDATVSLAMTAVGEPLDPGLAEVLEASTKPGSLGRIHHYEVMKVLGKGGMGTVLKAFDEKLQRVVAIKLLAGELAANPTARKRFIREAQAAAAVCDDHLVVIHAVHEEHRPPYLVMQFVDGPSLQQRLGQGPLELEEIVRLGEQIATGLAAAHKSGLIHRDIKPSNILLTEESDAERRPRVKITDFGLARAADDAHLTQTGVVAGTPMFMSPEQAEGLSIDHRSDLFSLGSVLYALCTGKAPFASGSNMAVMRRVCDDTPRPITELNPAIPAWLVEIIARLHAKKPEDRFQSASEVAAALRRQAALASAQEGGRTEHAPTSSAPRPAPQQNAATQPSSPPRRRRVLAVAASILLAMVAGLAFAEAAGLTELRATVVRFFTPEGTLVVEIDDPLVSVALDDGELIVNGAGAKEIRLKPGQYRLKASKEGKVFRQELVDIARAGRQIVKIFFVPREEVAAKPPAPVPVVVPEEWHRAVAAMPAEKQVEEVARKLKELNPGFDGKVESTISKDGVVVALRIKTEEVSNIDPVRALQGLRQLNLEAGVAGAGKLSDLTPLRGLALTRLAITANKVSDLSPLKDMPLVALSCAFNPIKNLDALRDMPLRALICGPTPLSDLKPLATTSLQRLECFGCPVSDLRPLAGLRLNYLNMSQTRIADLSPLKDMPLWYLHIMKTPVTDLSALRQMPLVSVALDLTPWSNVEALKSIKTLQFVNDRPAADFWKELHDQRAGLDEFAAAVAKMKPDEQVKAVVKKLQEMNKGFDGKHTAALSKDRSRVEELAFLTDAVTNISAVRALSGLERLSCAGSGEGKGKLADLSPLTGLQLIQLHCDNNPLADLSPLRGMPLKHLNCNKTQVADLTPLRDTKIVILECYGTKVRDLTALEGVPLIHFNCAYNQLTSLAPLHKARLTHLGMAGNKISDLRPLKGMKLIMLDCSDTLVNDLTPLSDMPLAHLMASKTPISDFSAVKKTPLARLRCTDTRLIDFTSIKALPLKELECDFSPWRDTEILKGMKTLETINERPVAAFWKEQDAERAAFDAWAAGVPKLSPDEQITAVVKKLQEMNPGFDGKHTSLLSKDKSRVMELGFATDAVARIAPVRALPFLQDLLCEGTTPGKGKLVDLWPLAGLKLQVVRCRHNPLFDLTPLKTLPLAHLICGDTEVADLSPLAGMKLERVECFDTKVSDLAPLKGQPLRTLSCGGTLITTLEPIRGMPLTSLNVRGLKISDLSPLEGMRLTQLICPRTGVKDLSIVKGMPLNLVIITQTEISDLMPLAGSPVTNLQCDVTKVTDLTPIQGHSLKELRCDFNPWRDTATLKVIRTLETINQKPAAAFWKEQETQRAVFDKWTADVAKMKPDDQARAVAKKLQELNPGFDGKYTAKLNKDKTQVDEFLFQTDAVTNIAPVRALAGLTRLGCAGSAAGKGTLVDLSPLRGMRLTGLVCTYNPIVDLTPLRGMALTECNCGYTKIKDLSPLLGQPITILYCGNAKITSLAPLKGMPLTSLICGGNAISDLAPLQGMPLMFLDCSTSAVSSLTPLEGMPLKVLHCDNTKVSDMTPLQNSPVKKLGFISTRVIDVSPLQKLAIEEVRLDFSPWRDTAALKSMTTLQKINSKPAVEFWKEEDARRAAFDEWAAQVGKLKPADQVNEVVEELKRRNPGFDGKLPHLTVTDKAVTVLGFYSDAVTDIAPVRALVGLETLHCIGTAAGKGKLSDLWPLAGLPLRGVYIDSTQVRDLTPLAKMRLDRLSISNTKVADLRPLLGMPLRQFWCGGSEVTDLSPLRDCPLIALRCDFTGVADLAPLRDKELGTLSFRGTRVQDFSLLAKLPLKDVRFDFNPWRDTEFLRSLKDLEKIDDIPAADFWKAQEAQRAALDKFCASMAKMTPEEQAKEIGAELKRRNAKFDGKVVLRKIDRLAGWELDIVTDAITDISPVRAMTDLKSLVLRGSMPARKGVLKDLWPLVGLPLAALEVSFNPISDLSPLRGMPLTLLSCQYCPVSDLTPLKDAPLSTINLGGTAVADLSALRTKDLNYVSIWSTRITSLAPLADAPLKRLDITNTGVASLAPLKSKDLHTIHCNRTLITDLSPLARFPLRDVLIDFNPWRDTEILKSIKTLEKINGKPGAEFWKEQEAERAAFNAWCSAVAKMTPMDQGRAVGDELMRRNPGFDGVFKYQPKVPMAASRLDLCTDQITDISPVRALAGLEVLYCEGSNAGKGKLEDLWPLRGMTLRRLYCGHNVVHDLRPLKGMTLEHLRLSGNPVVDLTPLEKKASLQHLMIGSTGVVDLSPLAGMKLTRMDYRATKVTDITPLAGAPLEVVQCTFDPARDEAVLRAIKTLRKINDKPAAEFWKSREK